MIKIFTKESFKDSEKLKTNLIILLNLAIFVFSALGVFLALIFARRDGYSHWYKRLLYFTQLSNIWIGAVSFIFAIKKTNEVLGKGGVKERMYLLKFIFTVSITVTGIIFCSFLAPFADFDVWSFSSVLTHVVVPILSIFEFFISANGFFIAKKRVSLALIPPALYFVFASILSFLKVDFGRGDNFPYFFMNFYSEVGLFGFKMDGLPQLGSFYWLVFFLAFIYGLGFLYRKIYNAISVKRK